MEKFPSDGETLNIADLFMRYTMDVSTELIFGKSMSSLRNPKDKVTQAFAEVQRMQNIFVRAGSVPGILHLSRRAMLIGLIM